jgi:truncated hemoglobin YjbI
MYASEEQEAAIERMVRLFYQRALANETLGPIFREAIHDWGPHIKTVSDFWSGVIHGTGRYRSNAKRSTTGSRCLKVRRAMSWRRKMPRKRSESLTTWRTASRWAYSRSLIRMGDRREHRRPEE